MRRLRIERAVTALVLAVGSMAAGAFGQDKPNPYDRILREMLAEEHLLAVGPMKCVVDASAEYLRDRKKGSDARSLPGVVEQEVWAIVEDRCRSAFNAAFTGIQSKHTRATESLAGGYLDGLVAASKAFVTLSVQEWSRR